MLLDCGSPEIVNSNSVVFTTALGTHNRCLINVSDAVAASSYALNGRLSEEEKQN